MNPVQRRPSDLSDDSRASPSPCQRLSLTCDKVSGLIQATGFGAAAALTFLATFYYESYPLTGLGIFCMTSSLIGLNYIRKYRNLRPINEISDDVRTDTQQIAQTAQRVEMAAKASLDSGKTLTEEDEKLETGIGHLSRLNKEREEEIDQLRGIADSLDTQNKTLVTENKGLKEEVHQLEKSLRNLSQEIENIKQQNIEFIRLGQEMGGNVQQLRDEEKTFAKVNADLGSNVSQLTETLQNAEGTYKGALREIRAQFDTFIHEITRLKSMVGDFQKLEERIAQKLEEERQLNLSIEQTRKLQQPITRELESIRIDLHQKVERRQNQVEALGNIAHRLQNIIQSSPQDQEAHRERKMRIERILEQKK